ncbi:Peroxisomal Membrane Protein PEX28-32 [Abortiporus biennis]
MATLDYVDIPSSATRLDSTQPSPNIRPAQKILTALPNPDKTPSVLSPTSTQVTSPTKVGFNLQQILLSSALPIPANATSTPRAGKGAPRLLTTKDPLSIPITTVNFRRFVSKSGPIFWLQDRLEEIVMWRKGPLYTSVWMAAYGFLCYFPRLILLLPIVILLGIVLATDPSLKQQSGSNHIEDPPSATVPPAPIQPSEGSVDWLANVQAIQNLMGAVSDAHDFILPAIPHLNHASPYTPIILTILITMFIILLPIINLLPSRITVLALGLLPLVFTHPFTRETLFPAALNSSRPHLKRIRTRIIRLIDNDRLEDKHWSTEMREVELWENERWALKDSTLNADEANKQFNAGWNKLNLKPGERRPWTRGRDGWSPIAEDGSGDVSNLTFSLSPGWLFVETEEWRPDLEGTWISNVGADDHGWVYTNDAWMDPHAIPPEEWKSNLSVGMTRRRRWIRRIYFHPQSTDQA